jgi:glycosyltransferase involved in cell wall biosynthesis
LELIGRAASYLKRNGIRRSLRLLRKKATGKVPWNIRHPALRSLRYFSDHGGTLVRGAGPARGLFGRPSIAIIGDLNLTQCRKYRVVQKLEGFEALGFHARFCAPQDVARAVDMLQTASHVLFYRLSDGPLFQALLGEARRLGMGVSYDIDDPIFDAAVYGGSRNLDFLDAGERRHLVGQCGHYLAAMRACDRIIVSTPALKTLAEARSGKPSIVWRNAVDAETRQAADMALRARPASDDGLIRIGYASGSRAHEADFGEVESALLALLENDPRVLLHVAGHHTLSPALKAFGSRVTTSPYGDYAAYLGGMAAVDVNVVPLLDDAFNDCKSAIRFLDAAMVEVPTIASRTGDFVNVVRHGSTGLLAGGGDWLALLRQLTESPGQRRTMGKVARRFAENDMAAARIARDLDPALIAEFAE